MLGFRTMLLVLVLLVGAGLYLSNFDIGGWDSLGIPLLGGNSQSGGGASPVSGAGDPPGTQTTIRVASVNLGPFDRQKVAEPRVMGRLVDVLREFDIVAVQDIRDRTQGVLVEFVEQLNAEGRHYDFAMAEIENLETVEPYSAFVFDRATVAVDRRTVGLVRYESNPFRYEPLVGSFIARGPNATEAFTFSLINVHTAPNRAPYEIDLLDDVFLAVRNDTRGEDDVILLGDLGVDDEHLGELRRVPAITWAISGIPTTTRGTQSVDNILFDSRATSEFTGRSGVVDLLSRFDLSMREAVEISDHLPIWAEFSAYEGGVAGQVAPEPNGVVQTRSGETSENLARAGW